MCKPSENNKSSLFSFAITFCIFHIENKYSRGFALSRICIYQFFYFKTIGGTHMGLTKARPKNTDFKLFPIFSLEINE